MASASHLSLLAVILLHFLILSTSAVRTQKPPSSKLMDAVCSRVNDPAFCRKTLAAYPPAAAATDLITLAEAVIDIGKSYAESTVTFIEQTAARDPVVNKTFGQCAEYYKGIVSVFTGARSELIDLPESANYDIMVTMDTTELVAETIGEAKDASSKALMERTRQMNADIDLAAGATDAVCNDHGHTTHH